MQTRLAQEQRSSKAQGQRTWAERLPGSTPPLRTNWGTHQFKKATRKRPWAANLPWHARSHRQMQQVYQDRIVQVTRQRPQMSAGQHPPVPIDVIRRQAEASPLTTALARGGAVQGVVRSRLRPVSASQGGV